MSNLNAPDKKILEKLFRMESGSVLNFSDRTIEEYFKKEFGIEIYDKKYDFEHANRSKANRLQGVWQKEDDKTVGGIILTLTDYAEADLLTGKKVISATDKELITKAREIAMKLLLAEFSDNFREVQAMRNKAQIIKDFTAYDFKNLKTNQRIYLLLVLYSYYEAIIRAYYGQGLFFARTGVDDLNDYFKVLRKKIIDLFDSDKTFDEMKNSNAYGQVIEQITGLYTSVEFLDVMWTDAIDPSLINLHEEIANKNLFENSSEIHKFSFAISNFIDATAKEIETLEKYLAQKNKNFYERELPKTKEHFDTSPGHNGEKVDDNFIVKNNKKRVTLPRFPRTEWSKVSIRFTDHRNILLSDGKDTKPVSFEGLGCDDGRNGRPDENWNFLLKLAKNDGQTPSIGKAERKKQKKQKQKITDILRKMFKNDGEPFDRESGGVYKAKFKVTYPNDNIEKITTKKELLDLNEVRSEMTESSQEDIEYDVRHNIKPNPDSEFSQ